MLNFENYRTEYKDDMRIAYLRLKKILLENFNVEIIERGNEIIIVHGEDTTQNWIEIKPSKSRPYALELVVGIYYSEDGAENYNYTNNLIPRMYKYGMERYGFKFSGTCFKFLHFNFMDYGFMQLSFNEEWFLDFLNTSYDLLADKIKSEKKLLEIEEKSFVDMPKTEKELLLKIRTKQGEFRNKLLNHYKQKKQIPKCKICNCELENLLIASHIKAWADCKNTSYERIDPNNGFLLCPSHDKLFDLHLITFDPNGNIKISCTIPSNQYKLLNINKDIRIKELTIENKNYLAWHRNKFYDKENSYQ